MPTAKIPTPADPTLAALCEIAEDLQRIEQKIIAFAQKRADSGPDASLATIIGELAKHQNTIEKYGSGAATFAINQWEGHLATSAAALYRQAWDKHELEIFQQQCEIVYQRFCAAVSQ